MAFFIYTARLIEAKRAKCKIENTQYWTPLISQETSTISSIAFYLQMEIQRTCIVQQSYMTVNKMSCNTVYQSEVRLRATDVYNSTYRSKKQSQFVVCHYPDEEINGRIGYVNCYDESRSKYKVTICPKQLSSIEEGVDMYMDTAFMTPMNKFRLSDYNKKAKQSLVDVTLPNLNRHCEDVKIKYRPEVFYQLNFLYGLKTINDANNTYDKLVEQMKTIEAEEKYEFETLQKEKESFEHAISNLPIVVTPEKQQHMGQKKRFRYTHRLSSQKMPKDRCNRELQVESVLRARREHKLSKSTSSSSSQTTEHMFTFPFKTIDDSLLQCSQQLRLFNQSHTNNTLGDKSFAGHFETKPIIISTGSMVSLSPGREMDEDMFNFCFKWMTCNVKTIRAFDTHFLKLLFATPSVISWDDALERQNTQDVLSRPFILLPFHASGYLSLFVVVGANNIRSYHKGTFKGARPCILHFDLCKQKRNGHNSSAVADKLRAWLNKVWRKQQGETDPSAAPFHKRSLPIISAKCSQHNTPNIGLTLLMYTSKISALKASFFSTSSYDEEKHHGVILHMKNWSEDEKEIKKLRLECVELTSSVTVKFATVLKKTQLVYLGDCGNELCGKGNGCQCASNEKSSEDGDDASVCGSVISYEGGSSIADDESNCSDGTFIPDSYESDSDSSVEEMYTDYENKQNRDKAIANDCSPDNLICPGDRVEYKSIHHQVGGDPVKRSVVVAIKDHTRTTNRYIMLQDNTKLCLGHHSLRKDEMYDAMTKAYIPNPLGEWFDVADVMLQEGTFDPADTASTVDDEESEQDDDCCSFNNTPRYVLNFIVADKNTQIAFLYISQLNDAAHNRCHNRSRKRNNQGLTEVVQKDRMRRFRKEKDDLDRVQPYPDFAWTELGSSEYRQAIVDINKAYRRMLRIGKAKEVFRESKKGLDYLLSTKTKDELYNELRNIRERFNRHRRSGKAMLDNFNVHTEIIPDGVRYGGDKNLKQPTKREVLLKEGILNFEQYQSSLNVFKCSVCLECQIDSAPPVYHRYVCNTCKRRNDPDFYIDNNLHPVWYLKDDAGEFVIDENGKPIPQYHIPNELKCLTMYEKLLIRRCANFVPTVHLKNGVFAIKGHAVTFPQNITEMCNKLPQKKESLVTFIRNIGNSNTAAVFPTSFKVSKHRIINALEWLIKHNPLYEDVTIAHENMEWMGDKDEVNLCTEAIQVDIECNEQQRAQDDEEEHVAACHSTEEQVDDYLPMHTIHENEKITLPKGEYTKPIKEFSDIAKQTGQHTKAMDFPPIDHESPIS